MENLRIHDWDSWQSYRADRGQPPWIKVHRCLMRNVKWVGLSDAERGQLISIWLLAADQNGDVPADPVLLGKLCFMSDTPDVNKFIDLGFLDAKVTPKRRQRDANVTHQKQSRDRVDKRYIPKNFSISDRVRKWAKEKGHNHLDERLEHFVSACNAKGYKYKNFDDAFMNAIRDDWAKMGKVDSYDPAEGAI